MSITLAEANKCLLSGTELSWHKFEDYKAGTIKLETPAARRIFHYLLNQDSKTVSEAHDKLFPGLIAAWEDEKTDPASNEQSLGSGDAGGSWRLEKLEASCFSGLTTVKGPVFNIPISGENWCLEGRNGSGKTSLASAVIWALTGTKIREQDGLIKDEGLRAPVFNEKGTRIGDWPPLASYPSTPEELKEAAEIWVRLTFKNEKGETAIAFRKISSPPTGTPNIEVNVDPRLLSAPQLIETGLLMPARIPRIGFGEKSQSLYEAVKLLTGLDQLADIAEGASNLNHRAKRFLKYEKDKGIDRYKETFQQNILKAGEKAATLKIDVSKLRTLGQKDLVKDIREAAAAASEKAGADLTILKSEIEASVDISKADGRNKIKSAVARARVLLDEAIKSIPLFEAWAALKNAAENKGFQNCSTTIADANSKLDIALSWHKKQLADGKLRLKALASQYYETPNHEHPIPECPLCNNQLTKKEQQALAVELAEIKENAEVAERKIDDVCGEIERNIRNNLTPELRKHFDLLSKMNPKEAYADAILARFANEHPFNDVLVGVASVVKTTINEQKNKLPAFEHQSPPQGDAGEPKSVVELRKLMHLVERLNSMVSWWGINRQSFVDALTDLIGKKDESKNLATRNIEKSLELLEQALEKAEPLDELSKHLTAAATAAEEWGKIKAHQDIREKIALAVEPLKELRSLVSAETASSIASLAEKIKMILDRIHMQERLAYENTSLEKKSVHVEGSFEPGMRIDAVLVANTSWLRAILWAFVLALREKTIEALGSNPFPLVVLDDPQGTFDPRNKRKWAEELARIANLGPKSKDNMQLLLTTHERQFSQCLMNYEKLNAQQGMLAGANKVTGVSTVVNGSCLARVYAEAVSKSDDALGHKYVGDVRIYCEDLLKFMLRAEGPMISNLNLDSLRKELKRLREAHVTPFNRKAFGDLLNTLAGGGKEMKLINDSHHQFDGTIGVAQAHDVKKFWEDILQNKIQESFNVHAEYEAHIGEPRVFPWEANVAQLPAGKPDEVKKITFFKTGIAAAAKTDGRAGDGEITIQEWGTADPVKLHNHDVYQLASGTLDPVANVGDLLIVSNYAKISPPDLVVTAFGSKLLARRYNETDIHPTVAILTGQAVDPYSLPQPIIAPLERIAPRKIVGTIFREHALALPPKDENNEIVALEEFLFVQNALENARLFQVKGRSAEPIALDGQFLITHQIAFNTSSIASMEGRLVIAVDQNGTHYFKRLRGHGEIIVLESLNPDGTTPTELLSLDGTNNLPKLTGLLTVAGILFEMPQN